MKGDEKMMEYPKYKKVLFCTDFSENSDYAFEFAYGIAKRDEGLLYILHVIPHHPNQDRVMGYVSKDILRNVQKDLEQELDDTYKDHYKKKIEDTLRFEVISKSGREDEEILTFAKDENVDIIVVGTHGKTGIEHVFFGSVAEKVLRRSPFPVFVIPCRKKLERP
jgi:nucleotide-binding universal stress UspA family protein